MEIDISNFPEEITTDVYLMMDDAGWLSSDLVGLSELYTTIGKVEVTFKIKQKDKITGDIVERLKDESKKIRADAEVECKIIDDKINSLLAIEND